MRVILTRHGETEQNKAGICQGQSIPGKLSEDGIAQAKQLALRLKDEKFDVIYSSDLARAADTAKEIAKFHSDTKIHLIKELRERDHGSSSGKHHSEIDYRSLPDDAESDEQLSKRAKKLIDEIYEKHKEDTVLLLGHGGINAAIISAVTGKPLLEVFGMAKWKNTNVNIFEIDEDKNHKIHCLNCTKHLEQQN